MADSGAEGMTNMVQRCGLATGLLARGLVLLIAAFVTGVVVPALPALATAPTIVSLTFDDGQASQYATLPMLQSRGMAGTYYINSGLVGSSGYYMTWPQIHDLYTAGNEIGGHTLNHTNLTQVTAATATTEVCNDRTNLINQGFPVTSFAYPYAAVNATAEQIVRDCGYTSGRGVGSLFDSGCSGCAYAETIPPRNAYNLRTAEPGTSTTALSDLQSSVTNAENNGGGWVPMVFHGICDNSCTGSNSMTTGTFTAFLDWLQLRAANGTVVRTVDQAMTGTSPTTAYPTTTALCNNAACSAGWYQTTPLSVTLTAVDAQGDPTITHYTTDGTDPVTGGTAVTYAGPFSVTQTTTLKFSSTDSGGNVEPVKTQLIRIDAAAPAVSVTSPTDGTSIKRGTKLTIAVGATDTGTGAGAASGIAQVAFYVDGNLLAADSTAPYQQVWNTRRFALGQHAIYAIATDMANNATTSVTISVILVK